MGDDLRVSGIHWSTYNECALCSLYRMSWGASRHPYNHINPLSKRLCVRSIQHAAGFGTWPLGCPEAISVTNHIWRIVWKM